MNFYILIDYAVNTGGLSTGTIAGIVVASLVSFALILVVLWRKGFLGGKDIEDKGGISDNDINCACKFQIIILFTKRKKKEKKVEYTHITFL